MSRKTSRSYSWFTLLSNAEAVFMGEATVIEEIGIPATETSFRGPGYRITAQVTPHRLLIGSLTDEKLVIQGETPRSPESRLSCNAAYFPPDSLHRIDYWDYAKLNTPQIVLVVLKSLEIMKVVTCLENDFPETISMIHSWLQLPEENQRKIILESLEQSSCNSIAYLVGFDILLNHGSEVSTLFKEFNGLCNRPGIAIQGIIDRLCDITLNLSQADAKRLAWTLLDAWKQENAPSALSGHLMWFDAYKQQIWQDDRSLREEVLNQIEQTQKSSFVGENAGQWEDRIRYYASTLKAKV